MFLLCVICSWHAFISMIDNLEVWNTFDGFIYSTMSEYNQYRNQTAGRNMSAPVYEVSYYFDRVKNQTMVKRSLLTIAERYDRYALIFFSVSYVVWHVIFVMWMYLSVNIARTVGYFLRGYQNIII